MATRKAMVDKVVRLKRDVKVAVDNLIDAIDAVQVLAESRGDEPSMLQLGLDVRDVKAFFRLIERNLVREIDQLGEQA